MISAAITSSSEAGAAVAMLDSTDWWVWIDTPQFPLKIPAKYLAIWTGSGRSSPRYFAAAATWAGEACGPAQLAAGFPGTAWAITNVSSTTPATTTTASASRRAMYVVNCPWASGRRRTPRSGTRG